VTRPTVPEKEIRAFLSGLDDWALLRNGDVMANFRRGGDCDLLVDDLEKAEELMREKLGIPVGLTRRHYVLSYFYPWGHFDLTDHYYWRGLQLMEGRKMLEQAREHSSGFPIVSGVDESITKLFGSLLWGGFIKGNYCDDILRSYRKEKGEFQKRLVEMVGGRNAEIICSRLDKSDWEGLVAEVGEIRRRTLFQAFRKRPIQSFFGQVGFFFREVNLRLRQLVPIMVLEMPEGSSLKDGREILKEELKELDSHLKILIGDGSTSSLAMTWRMARLFSFRSKNGLLVVLENERRPSFFSRFFNDLRMKVTGLEGADLEAAFDQFFSFARARILRQIS
jgi:hypothetical protein